MTRLNETGSIRKPWGSALPVALVYPNSYRLGMGNLGFQFLYHSLNAHKHFLAERFFVPGASEKSRTRVNKIVSEESGRPLADFAVVAFSIPFENDFPRVVKALMVGGISPLSKDRRAEDPWVIAGGMSVSMNPEPLAPFLDLIFIGEIGEEIFSSGLFSVLADELRAPRKRSTSRTDTLQIFQKVPGVYVPSAYIFRFRQDGIVQEIEPTSGFPETIQAQRRTENHSAVPASVLFSPEAAFGATLLVEVNRGCGRGCRFCASGWIHSPVRYASLAKFRQTIETVGLAGRTVGLIGSDLAGHPHLQQILEYILDAGGNFSLSSIRPEGLTGEIIRLIARTGQKTATLAPETASNRMKRVIGKRIPSDRFYELIDQLVSQGIPNIRLYFMIGLPNETDDDVQSIVDFVSNCRKVFLSASRIQKRIGKISVQLNPFVPKAWTPFQWAGVNSPKIIDTRRKLVARGLDNMANVTVRTESIREALIQGLFSLGDRRVSGELMEIARCTGSLASQWKKLSSRLAFYVHRKRNADEIFPWDMFDHGISKKMLRSVYEKAVSM